MANIQKKFLFWFLTITLLLGVTEASCHILFRIAKKTWIWEFSKQYDVFNVRNFTELVNDLRLITNRINAHSIVYKNRVYNRTPHKDEKGAWAVNTDENRFRIGRNIYYKDRYNIVFLGDSVPFGWGVDGNDSVPSFFYDLIEEKYPDKYGIINAAIPSYSLYQAVNRYMHEIDGTYPVKYVILQTLDPVGQFLIWGKKWRKEMCWTSRDNIVPSQKVLQDSLKGKNAIAAFIDKYSAINHVIYCIKVRIKKQERLPMLLNLDDKEAFDFFEKENIAILEEFYKVLKSREIGLILLSANPRVPHISKIEEVDQWTKGLTIVAEKLNAVLQKFADSHQNVYYFDVVAYFDTLERQKLFLPDFCHLSPYGAKKEAEFIFEEMNIRKMNI